MHMSISMFTDKYELEFKLEIFYLFILRDGIHITKLLKKKLKLKLKGPNS